ncbi:hypothetical protein C2G38_2027910 [Gigaspora rosea]|uniref:Uncharacterized protein n=1 Tax=Gigaspora rosea TaxID=44941 RepID=A0A397WBJ3_9GLOM|nr:hypothetical protein C2G38_2027910 [Gigaspora rosea]
MSDHRTQSVFSYPSPSTNPPPKTDISLREILDTYRDNNDLLKQILAAKAEEDKRRAEEEKYKTEAVRLQCKQVELEMLKEQKKPPTIFTGVPHAHFPANATTPTSATRLSPPSSSNDSVSYNHNGISSHNNSYNPLSQRPSLTLSIPSFPIITASPTTMHNQHPFSTPTSSVQEHPSSASSQTNHYSQSPTTGGKRSKPSSESEVDHEYVMEALRQKVQRNQENPAKKYMTVFKPRSSSTPAPPHNSTTNHQHHHHHYNRDQQKQQHQHQRHQSQQQTSPVDPSPMARSPIPPLPPMNVHSPGMNQEQVTKS